MNAIRRDEELDNLQLHLRRPVGLGKGHHRRDAHRVRVARNRKRHRRVHLRRSAHRARALSEPAHRPLARGVVHLLSGAGGPVSRSFAQGTRKTPICANIRRRFSLRSAASCARASRTTGARRTTTIGRSTANILFYNPLLDCAFEVSSMGIRVDPETLDRQLTLAGCDARRSLPFQPHAVGGQAAPDDGRRHRTVAPMYAAVGQGAHWRGSILHLGCADPSRLRGGGRHAAVRREGRDRHHYCTIKGTAAKCAAAPCLLLIPIGCVAGASGGCLFSCPSS